MGDLRIGGIASGFDTEQIVRDLMRIEQLKADRLYQERQVLEWKKEDFRAVINKIRAFRDTYFDLLNPESNLLSPATLKRRLISSSDTGLVTVTAGSDAAVGEIDLKIIQSAAAARAASAGGVTAIRSSEVITEPVVVTGEGEKNVINVTLNGKTKEITVAASEEGKSLDVLCGELQDELDAAFGEGRIMVNDDGGRLSFDTEYDSDLLTLVSKAPPGKGSILSELGIENGAANRLLLSDDLETVSAKLANGPLSFVEGENGNEYLTFKINGVSITVEKSNTLGGLLEEINGSGAGVHAEYNSFGDILSITALEMGSSKISVDESGSNFFKAFGIDVKEEAGDGNGTGYIGEVGREALFSINGIAASRPGNIFTIDGITYNIREEILKAAEGEADTSRTVKISVALDIEGIAENIEKFVEDYNELLGEINTKLGEEVFRDFSPLTAEQKEGMKEKEIELWEEKARSGSLRRESSLESMLWEMRNVLYKEVEGLHLFDIGLMTSNDYREQGKLVFKDGGSALRAALAEDPDKVAALFTKRADIDYSPDLTAEQRRERTEESGLAHRLSDILNDYIRTTRDKDGKKGILLEKAGIEGDLSEFRNHFNREIDEIDKRIDRMNMAFLRKEEQYYRQFTAMEKALQQLYAQSDWLLAQLGQLQSQ